MGRRPVTTPRFFVEWIGGAAEEDAEGAREAVLSPADSRHALGSLRLGAGEEVLLGDGTGGVGTGRLVGERDGRAAFEVLEWETVPRPSPSVVVAVSPSTGEGMRWATQKLAELGVDELWVLHTERSVRRWDAEPRSGRGPRARLERVAREAAMQSRQPFVMAIEDGGRLEDALVGGGSVVMLWERAVERLGDLLPERADGITLLVGPEGGFSEVEAETARSAGAAVASLGPSILRTETAAVIGAALTLARYGRLG